MVNSAEFAKRLEKILDYYGLSATAFSEKIEVNRSTISHLLSGRNKPSLEFVLKLIHTFQEVNLYWLLNGKGSFPTVPETEKIGGAPASIHPGLEIPSSPEISIPKHKSGERVISERDNMHDGKTISKVVDRIVIFYNDGSFKEYLP